MTKIQPINSKLLIEPIEYSNKIGNLTIPKDKDDKKRPEQGKIIAMAKDIEKDIEIKVGDIVLFDKYNADIYKIDEKEHMILSVSDVHAIVKGK